MGIRSEVGLAVTPEVFTELRKSSGLVKELLDNADDELVRDGEGVLFVWSSIKWYTDNDDISALLKALEKLDAEEFLLIEACSEYPDSGMVRGEWVDNPFDLEARTTVELHYS